MNNPIQATEMYLRLDGLKFYAFHGVLPQEQQTGAEFTVDLRIKTDFSSASVTDNLEGTINYATVFNAVRQEMNISSRLLEHVAFRIARRILTDFPEASEVRISLFKQNPPMGADARRIGVEALYQRSAIGE